MEHEDLDQLAGLRAVNERLVKDVADRTAENERLMRRMTFRGVFEVSVIRANRWHNGDMNDWSALEWAGAMCGEAGEAANAAKKLKRLELQMQTINVEGRHYGEPLAARRAVMRECADTILYALLLMARVGTINPEHVIREVFNEKSIEYGFEERI